MGYLVILLKESIMGLDYMWGMVEMMHLDDTRAWTTLTTHLACEEKEQDQQDYSNR